MKGYWIISNRFAASIQISLGREDLLEKGMAIHSSILAWRILWTEEPGERQSMVSQRSDMTEQLALSLGLGNIHRMFGTGTDTW